MAIQVSNRSGITIRDFFSLPKTVRELVLDIARQTKIYMNRKGLPLTNNGFRLLEQEAIENGMQGEIIFFGNREKFLKQIALAKQKASRLPEDEYAETMERLNLGCFREYVFQAIQLIKDEGITAN